MSEQGTEATDIQKALGMDFVVKPSADPEGPLFECPVCGDEYEPDYHDKADAPERTAAHEQHQTGICSDECWQDGVVG